MMTVHEAAIDQNSEHVKGSKYEWVTMFHHHHYHRNDRIIVVEQVQTQFRNTLIQNIRNDVCR